MSFSPILIREDGAGDGNNVRPPPAIPVEARIHGQAHNAVQANLDRLNNNLDAQNNNVHADADGLFQELLAATADERRRIAAVNHAVRDGGADGEWEESMILQHPDLFEFEPQLDPNDATPPEVRLFKHISDYQAVQLGKCSVFGIVAGWIFLFFPNTSIAYVNIFRYIIPLLLLTAGVVAVATKEDIAFFRPFRALEMRIFQMVMTGIMGIFMDVFVDQVGPSLRLFYFNVKNGKVFNAQLDSVRQNSYLRLMDEYHWPHINAQLFSLSFCFFLIFDVTSTLWRISNQNPVISSIVKYELSEYLCAALKVIATVLFVNEISFRMNPAKQSIPFWTLLLLLAFSCIAITIWDFANHSDIPLRRPMGIRGYMYMEVVTIFQISLGLVLHTVFLLIRDVYYGSVPGAFWEAFHRPGIIVGPPLFLNQIMTGIPVDKWNRRRLFEPSYDLFHGLFFIIFVIRHFKLRGRAAEIRDRIEEL